MIYGAGFKYLLLAAVVWTTGLPFFFKSKKEYHQKYNIYEILTCIVIIIMAIAGLIGLFTNTIKFN